MPTEDLNLKKAALMIAGLQTVNEMMAQQLDMAHAAIDTLRSAVSEDGEPLTDDERLGVEAVHNILVNGPEAIEGVLAEVERLLKELDGGATQADEGGAVTDDGYGLYL